MKTFTPEAVGRTYTLTEYRVHSRRIGGDGIWRGISKYPTREDAIKAIRSMGEPFVGGMVSFGPGKEPFEYRVVHVESQCTVEHVENQLI